MVINAIKISLQIVPENHKAHQPTPPALTSSHDSSILVLPSAAFLPPLPSISPHPKSAKSHLVSHSVENNNRLPASQPAGSWSYPVAEEDRQQVEEEFIHDPPGNLLCRSKAGNNNKRSSSSQEETLQRRTMSRIKWRHNNETS